MSIKQNIVIEQGATFSQSSTLTDKNGNPFDTAGCTVAGSLRKNVASSTSVALNVTLSNGNVLTLEMDADVSLGMTPGRYLYDVILTRPNGTVDRLLEGIATITPAITHT